MDARETLGQVEFAVLDAVHQGRLHVRPTSRQVASLREAPGGEATLHDALHRCEECGLLRSTRHVFGRRYELTAAGRARLRADRRFRRALARLLLPAPASGRQEPGRRAHRQVV